MTTIFPRHLLVSGLVLALAACDPAPEPDGATGIPPPAVDTAMQEPVPAGDDIDAVQQGGVDAGDVAAGTYTPRWDGFGPATFGMTADEVRAAWDGALGDNPVEAPACFHLSPTSQPEYAYFAMMFGEDRFVRYSASNDAMTAPGGGERGMSASEIETLYPGGVERQPHKYSDGEYLRIQGEDEQVLIFETDEGGTVTEWRVGVPPYIDYVEGCA